MRRFLIILALVATPASADAIVTMSQGRIITRDTEVILRQAITAGADPTLALLGVSTAPNNPSLAELTPFAAQLLDGEINAVRWTDTRNVFQNAADNIKICGEAIFTVGSVTGETGIRAEIASGKCRGQVGRFLIEIAPQ
jgi:hypothetical protein